MAQVAEKGNPALGSLTDSQREFSALSNQRLKRTSKLFPSTPQDVLRVPTEQIFTTTQAPALPVLVGEQRRATGVMWRVMGR